VQQIHFVAEAPRIQPRQRQTRWPEPPSKPAAKPSLLSSAASFGSAGLPALSSAGATSERLARERAREREHSSGFSEIKVSRHFIQPHAGNSRGGPEIGYHYMVWGPQSSGFQHFFTQVGSVFAGGVRLGVWAVVLVVCVGVGVGGVVLCRCVCVCGWV